MAKEVDGSNIVSIEKGQIYGNGFSGRLERVVTDGAKPVVNGELAFDTISLEMMTALASGQYFSDEQGSWATSEFAGPPLSGINGRLKLSSNRTDIGLEDDGSDLGLDIAMDDGDFSASGLSLKWKGADISGGVTLAHSEGTSVLNGQLTATGVDSAILLDNLGIGPVLSGKGNISGTLEASGNSPRALMRSLTGSGLVAMEQGEVIGVGNNALLPVLQAADRENFEITSATVAPLVRDVFLDGRLQFANLEAPFSLTRGNLQFRNITIAGAIDNARAAPLASVAIDLVDGVQESEIRLFPDPGKGQVSGASPDIGFSWKGPLGEPELAVDTSAMEGFLSIRSFENEQRRVEILQASILEKQRFRYELLKSRSRDQWLEAKREEEERLAREEAERKAKEEAERIAREEEARIAAENARLEAERLEREREERLRLETEKLLQAEREARQVAEEARKVKAAEEAEAARAAEEAKAAAAAERQRLEDEEAEKRAAETSRKASEARSTEQTSEQKSGFEIRALPEPKGTRVPDIFRNIEELLNAQ